MLVIPGGALDLLDTLLFEPAIPPIRQEIIILHQDGAEKQSEADALEGEYQSPELELVRRSPLCTRG
jgi:hypothetical protein